MDESLLPWTEKYRPRHLKEVIGQKPIVQSLDAFVKARNMPNLLFSGPPGIGKTTSTLALARDLYGDNISGNFIELNASDERGIDIVRGKIKDFARSIALGKVPFKLIFLDEADSLTSDAQHALRRTMESYSSVTRFILSCNYSSKIIEPIQSRCAIFRFLPLREEEVFGLINHVAKAEELSIGEESKKALAYVCEGDMRKVLNVLQGAALHGKNISEKTVHMIASKAKPAEVKQMMDVAMLGKFLEARELLDKLIISYGLSGEDILFQMYREVLDLKIEESKKAHLIDRIGEFNFRMVEGANERIQLEALLAYICALKA